MASWMIFLLIAYWAYAYNWRDHHRVVNAALVCLACALAALSALPAPSALQQTLGLFPLMALLLSLQPWRDQVGIVAAFFVMMGCTLAVIPLMPPQWAWQRPILFGSLAGLTAAVSFAAAFLLTKAALLLRHRRGQGTTR